MATVEEMEAEYTKISDRCVGVRDDIRELWRGSPANAWLELNREKERLAHRLRALEACIIHVYESQISREFVATYGDEDGKD